ncbi:MAG: hypothetical protein KBA66_20920 [Leptospiraceae bacterium]|nr:hypothetical protein [Leptospiraceae bacterium]
MFKKYFFAFILIYIFTVSNTFSEETSNTKRRTYLNWHQGLGLATWVSWLATNLAGEEEYREKYKFYQLRDNLPNQLLAYYAVEPSNDKLLLYYVVKNFEEKEHSTHGQLGYLTFGLYTASAAFAFLSPAKIDNSPEEGWNTIWTHKSMIFIHLPAMLALPYIGANMHTAKDVDNMRAIGWIGFSALSVSIATFYF